MHAHGAAAAVFAEGTASPVIANGAARPLRTGLLALLAAGLPLVVLEGSSLTRRAGALPLAPCGVADTGK